MKLSILISILFIVSACSDINLRPPEEPEINSKSAGDFCISPPEDIERYTKFLFVMDKSGSNNETDPGATKRANNIEKFYNDNLHEDFFKWGMIAFYNSNPQAYIQNPYFTQDEPIFRDAISRLRGPDAGSTPYLSTLGVTREAIRSDIEENLDEDSVYMVFFVSDGVPTDTNDIATIRSSVRDIVSLRPGRIFVSTAYYGPNSGTATSILEGMADEGGGKFVNFNNTDELDFNELVVKPTKEPWGMKKMLTYNLNAGFCLNGDVGVDSDADGLCDIDERQISQQYGPELAELGIDRLDPAKRFSLSEGPLKGYGDYFVWRYLVFGEVLNPCEDREDKDFDMLTKCEEAHLKNQRPSGTDRFNGDPLNPDTDLDGYLDGIEIYTFKDKGSANDDQNVSLSFDFEEEDAGTQISEHRNPLIYDPQAVRYDMRVFPTGIEGGKSCYSFSQTVLELFTTLEVRAEDTLPGLEHAAGENVVYLYYIQTPQSDKNGPGVLKYSFQKLMADNRKEDEVFGLKVRDDVFSSYVVPISR